MAVLEEDISMVLGKKYESSYRELKRSNDATIQLFVKRNAVKGAVIVQWKYDERTQWSFNHDCFCKTADEIAQELAEQVQDARSFNDLSIRIFKYTTPV